ncbi:MAG: hypothetical protein EXR02_05990 [Rhodospirillales bacterium]|nr:hypothetical protein [Rhodospirillales bacterium]MSP80601.1 hypothetical protein [Rhodospirillales bacterium]
MRKTPNRNTVTPADAHLWRAVAASARPLKRKRGRSPLPRADLSAGTEKEKIAAPATLPPRPPKTAPKPARNLSAPSLSTLHPGAAPGVDRHTAASLRRGELPIDATLDLHGYTQAEAHTALIVAIARARAAGHRCMLVVTGKGGREGAVPPGGGRYTEARTTGVLRANAPRWLNELPLRAHVLAFANASPRHGGAGALYVLIRRVREARAR